MPTHRNGRVYLRQSLAGILTARLVQLVLAVGSAPIRAQFDIPVLGHWLRRGGATTQESATEREEREDG